MTDVTTNPREQIGGNMPPLPALISDAAEKDDFAKLVTEWLNDRFGSSPEIAAALLQECADLMRDPATGEVREIADDDTKGKVKSLIKRIRDEAKKLTGLHEKEKIAYHRGGQAVDQFFFGLIDKLSRRDKKNRPGAADVLNAKLTDYDTRVLAAKQAELRRQANEAAMIAREKQEAEAKAAKAAEEARLAAERARKPEIIEEKKDVAIEKEAAASAAAAETTVAVGAAQAARIETFSKPADLMRNRGDDGTLSTMATEPYAVVTDSSKLDKEKLWPFFTEAEKEKALRGWAKNTGFTAKMEEADVGRKPKSVVR